jgi:hypothetical protein
LAHLSLVGDSVILKVGWMVGRLVTVGFELVEGTAEGASLGSMLGKVVGMELDGDKERSLVS